MTKKPFLVCYDYGQGGVWAFVEAASEHDILRRFPELQVVGKRPSWMSETEMARIRERRTLDLDRPSGLLQDLIAQRDDPSVETG